MNKRIFLFILTVVSIFFLFPGISEAVALDEILPPPEKIIGREGGPPTGKVTLPSGDFRTEVVPAAITLMLSVAGSIAFITFTVAGIMLIVAQGNEEMITKVKNIFMYAAIGLAIIALSYAIVYGIFTLRFGEVIGEAT